MLKACVVDNRHEGCCADGSWDVPSIWSKPGGRLISTALMDWPLHFYYRFPLTFALRRP